LFFCEEWTVKCFRSLDDIGRAQNYKIACTEEYPQLPPSVCHKSLISDI